VGCREVCISDRVSKVQRDELHGLLQFQGENAKFMYADFMDCVASKCTLEGSEQVLWTFWTCVCVVSYRRFWVANGSTHDCQRRKSMRGEDLVCLSSSEWSVMPEVVGRIALGLLLQLLQLLSGPS
jgi:hypothetical protein